MFGAVAGGAHPTIVAASQAMAPRPRERYAPGSDAVEVYGELYRMYVRLHDLFGRGGDDVMRELKGLQYRTALRPAPASA
jgi:L-ribulokinase